MKPDASLPPFPKPETVERLHNMNYLFYSLGMSEALASVPYVPCIACDLYELNPE